MTTRFSLLHVLGALQAIAQQRTPLPPALQPRAELRAAWEGTEDDGVAVVQLATVLVEALDGTGSWAPVRRAAAALEAPTAIRLRVLRLVAWALWAVERRPGQTPRAYAQAVADPKAPLVRRTALRLHAQLQVLAAEVPEFAQLRPAWIESVLANRRQRGPAHIAAVLTVRCGALKDEAEAAAAAAFKRAAERDAEKRQVATNGVGTTAMPPELEPMHGACAPSLARGAPRVSARAAARSRAAHAARAATARGRVAPAGR